MTSHDERSARVQFSERYATPSAAVSHDIERRVIGAVWGVNGYTTLNQADEIGRLLHLGPVVDCSTSAPVGAGPACTSHRRLVARSSAPTCRSRDPRSPRSAHGPRALMIASVVVAAAGAHQPFRQVRSMRSCSPTFSVDCGRSSPCCERSSGSFDPEVESLQRRSMWLKASGRPLVGERYAPDHEPSPPAARKRACSTRRASRRSENATSHPEFAVTARAWLTEWDAHADVLAPLEPPGGFELRQRERRAQLSAVEDGLPPTRPVLRDRAQLKRQGESEAPSPITLSPLAPSLLAKRERAVEAPAPYRDTQLSRRRALCSTRGGPSLHDLGL